jgi:septin family protein
VTPRRDVSESRHATFDDATSRATTARRRGATRAMGTSTCVVCGAPESGKTTVVNGIVRETLRDEFLLDADADARGDANVVVDEVRRTTRSDASRTRVS